MPARGVHAHSGIIIITRDAHAYSVVEKLAQARLYLHSLTFERSDDAFKAFFNTPVSILSHLKSPSNTFPYPVVGGEKRAVFSYLQYVSGEGVRFFIPWIQRSTINIKTREAGP